MPADDALKGAEVSITGRLLSMPRVRAEERLQGAGARPARDPGPSTDLLVAGEGAGHLTTEGAVSRGLILFQKLKSSGSRIRLVGEADLLRLLGADDEITDLARLYTTAQVSRIAGVSPSEVRGWVRRGLLQPARQSKRLAWFEFKDIAMARDLSRLTSSGVPATVIHRSLTEIARWLPDGGRLTGRLEAYARGLSVRLRDGGLADPSGQLLMDFQPDGPGSAAERDAGERVASFRAADGHWLARAEDAEERGDLRAAAGAYERALESGRKAELLFNLGNVLYELGREAEAAERYLEAIREEQDFPEAWNNLGNALVALARLEDSVRAYEMALSLEPEYPDPHCNLATVLERLGRPDRAASHRAACLRAMPSEERLTLLRGSP